MKSKWISFALFMFLSLSLSAQNLSTEFGVISRDDLAMNKYAADTSAEAVVLFDYGKSYFVMYEGSFELIFERTTRIKIFSEAGLKWANVEIPFYQEHGIFEQVYDIEGNTYNTRNEDYDISAVRKDGFHDEILDESWKVKKFVMPDVKPGSIIEYRYKISSKYFFNLRDWEFQREIPTMYSEYVVRLIPFYEYSWLLQNADKFDIQESYIDKNITRQWGLTDFHDMVHRYSMKAIPAFKDEDYISSINDYLIRIDFQLDKVYYPDGSTENILTTWPELIKEMVNSDYFGKYSKKSEKLAGKLFNLDTLSLHKPMERFAIIMDYVKANYNWNGYEGKYATKSPNEFLEDKFGNSADINLFTIGLLNAAGIESYPVLISSRHHGKIRYDYPYIHFFNYVVILSKINGKFVIGDATEIYCSNFRIPPRCINDKGLVINKETEDWVNLQCATPSEIVANINLIPALTTSKADIVISAKEYDALNFRKDYGDDQKKILEYLDDFNMEIDEEAVSIENSTKKEKPYILKYSTSYKTENVNGKLYIQPFLQESLSDNPLKQPKRNFPLDIIYPVKRTFISKIAIPDGYKAEFLPEAYSMTNDLIEIFYTVSQEENELNISFTYTLKKSVYSVTDYDKIRSCFNLIVKKGNEKIVLSKI